MSMGWHQVFFCLLGSSTMEPATGHVVLFLQWLFSCMPCCEKNSIAGLKIGRKSFEGQLKPAWVLGSICDDQYAPPPYPTSHPQGNQRENPQVMSVEWKKPGSPEELKEWMQLQQTWLGVQACCSPGKRSELVQRTHQKWRKGRGRLRVSPCLFWYCCLFGYLGHCHSQQPGQCSLFLLLLI